MKLGDALTMLLIPDKRIYERCKALSPHTSVMDLNKPRTVSSAVKIHSPVISTLSNWLSKGMDKAGFDY